MLAAVAGENLEVRREQLQLQVAQLAGHLRERLRRSIAAKLRLMPTWPNLSRTCAVHDSGSKSESWPFSAPAKTSSNGKSRSCKSGPCLSRSRRKRTSWTSRLAQPNWLSADQQIQLREDDLRERRFEFDRQSVALRHAQQLWQQQRERQEQQLNAERTRLEQETADQRQQMSADFEQLVTQREEQLHSAELLIAEHARQLETDRAALGSDCHAWLEQQTRQRQAIDELRSSAEAELTDRRARLAARQEWIERQKSGLEQVRDEALRLHRQMLEMRLLSEQLWSQITGAITPAEVTQAIAQLRLKLTLIGSKSSSLSAAATS